MIQNRLKLAQAHKTGSSTLQNIIYRYSLTYNLTVGLPMDGKDVYLCKHKLFRRDCTDEENYQVIANHHIWSPVVDEVLPDAKKITILRDPLTQTLSSFFYFDNRVLGIGKTDKSLAVFEEYVGRKNIGKKIGSAIFRENSHNPSAFDLGRKVDFIYRNNL